MLKRQVDELKQSMYKQQQMITQYDSERKMQKQTEQKEEKQQEQGRKTKQKAQEED